MVVFECHTHKGVPLRVRKEINRGWFGKLKNYRLVAEDVHGNIMGDRIVEPRGRGIYELYSKRKDRFAGQTIVERPKLGIGSLLVALGLGIVVEEGGREAYIEGVERDYWSKHLINKMGGASRKKNIIWTEKELSPPGTEKETHWHDFLPEEIRARLQKQGYQPKDWGETTKTRWLSHNWSWLKSLLRL